MGDVQDPVRWIAGASPWRILDTAPVGIAVLDRDLCYRYVNRAACLASPRYFEGIIGLSLAEALGRAFDPDTARDLHARFAHVLETGDVLRQAAWSLQQQRLRPEDRHLDFAVHRLESDDGRVIGLQVVLTDVTPYVVAQQRLRASEERFRGLADGVPQLVWVADAVGGFSWVNRLWRDYTGLDAEALAGQGWIEALHPDDRAPTLTAWAASQRSGERYQVEYRLRRSDGAWRWFLARAWPSRDHDGRILQWIGTCTDVHEGRIAADSLRQAVDRLQTSERELSDRNAELDRFAAMTAHDLQSPLRTVASYLELIARREGDRLSAAGRDWIRTTTEAAARMRDLIASLLAYARSGQLEREERRCFPLAEAVAEAIGNLEAQIRDAGAAITVGDLPSLEGSRVHLALLMQNLIGNALRFRSPRRPEIDIRARRVDERWEITVRDNGIGIPPAEHERVFALFQRAHAVGGGSGIGLATCRRIAELHGGGIRIERSSHEGTTVLVWLPG